MNDLEILGEIVRQSIATFFALLQLALVASYMLQIKLYIDNRSSKKAVNAAFKKIRYIENWARSQGYIPPSDDEINKTTRG